MATLTTTLSLACGVGARVVGVTPGHLGHVTGAQTVGRMDCTIGWLEGGRRAPGGLEA